MVIRPYCQGVVAVLALACVGCEPTASPTEHVHLPARTNVLLITLDTTRADRLGCYGYAKAKTPALDALAREGTVYDRAYAQVPLTLPSHATILTGRYPREHGIRLNGRNALPASVPTLGESFQQHSYATGAFVASSVLDARFGLNRGFDVYDDEMGAQKGGAHGSDVQRPGDHVVDAAIHWFDSVKDRPFFAWLHFYDPHHPYDAPSPYSDENEDPYDGEIAFVDAQISRVMDYLKDRKIRKNTLIVVVGDHGESFGEHGETGHMLLLYNTNLHVPLILNEPGVKGGGRVSVVVEVGDVFPTILESLDWALPTGLLSTSRWRVTPSTGSGEESYSESLYGHQSFGWAEQHALTTRRWKYISSTLPELYDLVADPHEKANVVLQFPEVVKQMQEALAGRYGRMVPGNANAVTLSPKARRELESLGYLTTQSGTGDGFLTSGAPDPKRMIEAYGMVTRSQELIARGQMDEPIELLTRAVAVSPASAAIHFLLGTTYQRLARHDEAVGPLLSGLAIDGDNPEMLLAVAGSLATVGRNKEAESHFRAALSFDEIAKNTTLVTSAHFNLGVLAEKRGDLAGATVEYEKILSVDPGHEKSVLALVNTYLSGKRVNDAVRVLRSALPTHPRNLNILRPLSSLLATVPDPKLRDGAEAVRLAERGVGLSERKDPILLATLAAAHAETGQFDLAVQIGTEAIEMARGRGMARLADFIEQQLKFYRAGRPFHDGSLSRE